MKRIVINDTGLFSSFMSYTPERIFKSGEMIELGSTMSENGVEWIEVLAEGTVAGYIKGDTNLINPDKYCYIAQEFANVYESPDLESRLIKIYKRNEELYLIGKTEGSKVWYKTFDITGNIGYIEGDTIMKSSEVHGQRMVLNEDYVKIYLKPDENSEVLASKLSGLELTLLDLVKDSQGSRWFHIETQVEEGYIKGSTRMLTAEEKKLWQKDIKKEYEERLDTTDEMGMEKWLFRKGIAGGFVLIILALIWLVMGYYLANAIYIYPFIMILIGIFAIVRHVYLSGKS